MLKTSDETFGGGVVAVPAVLVAQLVVPMAQSTIANFSVGLDVAAVAVAAAIR